jgi:hypothetical protein
MYTLSLSLAGAGTQRVGLSEPWPFPHSINQRPIRCVQGFPYLSPTCSAESTRHWLSPYLMHSEWCVQHFISARIFSRKTSRGLANEVRRHLSSKKLWPQIRNIYIYIYILLSAVEYNRFAIWLINLGNGAIEARSARKLRYKPESVPLLVKLFWVSGSMSLALLPVYPPAILSFLDLLHFIFYLHNIFSTSRA